MATFCPTSAFRSVDFPAFGRPTSDTNPDRNPLLMRDGLRFAEAHLADMQFVAGQDLYADAVPIDEFTRLRHMAEPFRNQPADGCRFYIFLAVERFEQVAHAVQIETPGDNKTAVAVFDDVAVRLVLVAALANDHFQQVFNRGQPGGVAVLVHHDYH